MYPFMTLDDEAEITHSEYKADGRVKVYVEKADEKDVRYKYYEMQSDRNGKRFYNVIYILQ